MQIYIYMYIYVYMYTYIYMYVCVSACSTQYSALQQVRPCGRTWGTPYHPCRSAPTGGIPTPMMSYSQAACTHCASSIEWPTVRLGCCTQGETQDSKGRRSPRADDPHGTQAHMADTNTQLLRYSQTKSAQAVAQRPRWNVPEQNGADFAS